MAVDMTRINLGVVNRRAARKYAEFWAALVAVGEALAAADRLAAQASDHRGGSSRGSGGRHWSVASPEELRAAVKKTHRSLRVISASAKRWEAELVSKDWR